MTKVDYSASIDCSRDAKAMLIKTVEAHGLNYITGDDESGYFDITLPVQRGLSFEVWLCLQNNDELWLGTDFATFSMFPFDDTKEAFADAIDGLILGEYRIYRVPTISKWIDWFIGTAKLQKPEGKGWSGVATSASLFGWLILPWINQEIANKDATNLSVKL